MSNQIGIDFGTSNSALAVKNEKGQTEVVQIGNGAASERTLNSLLFIGDDYETFVGQQAIAEYLLFGGSDCRFFKSLKAFLSQPNFRGTWVFNRRLSIEKLASFILKEIKTSAENELGTTVESVSLGRPVFFSENDKNDQLAEDRLRDAALLAGFSSVDFEFEPVAATLAYMDSIPEGETQTLLVGDFGGGTSDFAVMKLTAGKALSKSEVRERVLATDGVYVGGDTFDGRLMAHVVNPVLGADSTYRSMSGGVLNVPSGMYSDLQKWHRASLMPNDQLARTLRNIRASSNSPELIAKLEHVVFNNKSFAIFQAIEKAKKALSENDEAVVSYEDEVLQFSKLVSRREFEEIILDDVLQLDASLDRCMIKSGVSDREIDRVLLTGGSSFIPSIRQIFERRFGESRIVSLDAFTSVAQGLIS